VANERQVAENFPGMTLASYNDIKLWKPNNNWMQTADNKRLLLGKPSAMSISPNLFGKLTCRLPRFGTHCREDYSVGQHLMLCMHLAPLLDIPKALYLPLLLHDFCECYTGFGDVTAPAKWLDPYVNKFLKEHEQRFKDAIANRFGFDSADFDHRLIKLVDLVALHIEKLCVMGEPPAPWIELPEIPKPLADEIAAYRDTADFATRENLWDRNLNRETHIKLHDWSLAYIFNESGPTFARNLDRELKLLWSEEKTVAYHIHQQGK